MLVAFSVRLNLLRHNNLMLRSERRERLEAWAASDSTYSNSQPPAKLAASPALCFDGSRRQQSHDGRLSR